MTAHRLHAEPSLPPETLRYAPGSMLKSLDVILSLTSVMLAASLAVTVLTQIYVGLRNSRGTHLRDGLVDLLKQIDPTFTAAVAHEIAGAILRHPMIRDSARRLGSLVHRDEFTHLVIQLAAGEGLKCDTKTALRRALEANGIADPAAALNTIRDLALEFEATHPTAAAHVRREMAILHGAKSHLVATVNGWFDQTIDRISARFTLTTRQVSLVAALAVAVVLRLDSVELIERLASGGDASAAHGCASQPPATFAGIALSTLLLSLGAPFWFEALKNLLRLRTAIATKDDEQRAARSTAADTPSER